MADAPGTNAAKFSLEYIEEFSNQLLEWNNNPQSSWLAYSLVKTENITGNIKAAGRVEYEIDKFDIKGVILDDPDRYAVNKTVTSESYRTHGSTTVSVRPFRLVGVHSDTEELLALNKHNLNIMTQEQMIAARMKNWQKQYLVIQEVYDILMYKAWTASQTEFTSGAPDQTVTAGQDGVTEYEIQTDISIPTVDNVNALYRELSTLKVALAKKGGFSKEKYIFSVPLEVSNLLNQYKGEQARRLIDPYDAKEHNTDNTPVFNGFGLFCLGVDDNKLGTFTSPENGVYGYCHNRDSVASEFANYNRASLMFGASENSADAMAFAASMQAVADKAQAEGDTRGRAVMVSKALNDGFGSLISGSGVQKLHFMAFDLTETNPYYEAQIMDMFCSPVRLRGNQFVRLKFLYSKLPDALSLSPIPTTSFKSIDSSSKIAQMFTEKELQEAMEIKKYEQKMGTTHALDSKGRPGFEKGLRSHDAIKQVMIDSEKFKDSVAEGHSTALPDKDGGRTKPRHGTKYVGGASFDATNVKDQK